MCTQRAPISQSMTPSGGWPRFSQTCFRILEQTESRERAADPDLTSRNRFDENQAISIREGLQDWEVDADDVILGQRVALGGYAEVYIGKYEVRAAPAVLPWPAGCSCARLLCRCRCHAQQGRACEAGSDRRGQIETDSDKDRLRVSLCPCADTCQPS